jgi:hypothetical protein
MLEIGNWKLEIRSAFFNGIMLGLLVLISLSAIGQSVHVSAKMDSTSMRIGEQVHLQLNATTPLHIQVVFPPIPDTIHKLEVVQRSAIDTTKAADGKTITYHQQITITGFDSGYYVVEPFTFRYRKEGSNDYDTLSTEAMLLHVMTVPVDTTQQIKDIKPPVEVPFTFMDALPYIIGAAVLFVIVYLLIRYLRKRKKVIPQVVIKKPKRPAHEIALESLRKIQDEKLWQQGFYKQYHSAVTDAVRTYIEHRFEINAMEFTTDETLEHFRNNLISPEAKEKLRQILQLADMVKFAKAIPVGTENELTMQQAFDFIALTKPATKEDFVTPSEEKKEVIS